MDFDKAKRIYEQVARFYGRYLRPIIFVSYVPGIVSWFLEGPVLITGFCLGVGSVALVSLLGGWITTRMEDRRVSPAPVIEQATPATKGDQTVRAQLERQLGISNSTGVQLEGQPIVLVGEIQDIGDSTVSIRTQPGGEEIGVRRRPNDTEYLRTLRRGDSVRVTGTIRYIIRDHSDHVMIDGIISPPGESSPPQGQSSF